MSGHPFRTLIQWCDRRLESPRLALARGDDLPRLALLGLITGIGSGGVIVLFRLLVEGAQDGLLPGSGPENYEALNGLQRFFLPILGSLLLVALFRWWFKGVRFLGIARVMEVMAYRQGRFSGRGFLPQFIGSAVAIISGHSVGREGPHVYLGAAGGSLLGQWLDLPNNAIRTMVGCGTAAGIAASFNTPLAAVIFVLEVVMMEYTFASFIPVILATVSATALSNAVLGSSPAFTVPELALGSLAELPLVLLLGVAAGVLAAAFIHALQLFGERFRDWSLAHRVLLAGVIMGACGWAVPEVMGIGYDTVDEALIGELGITLLLTLVVVKLIATAASVGLGVPGGMIGPSMFMGAALGSLIGIAGDWFYGGLYGGLDSSIGLYALLGMGAMMGASLQAPLAALTAMMELTHEPGVILPGMLAVVTAGLTAGELFHKESLFLTLLKSAGLDYDTHPARQALRRSGVASVMNRGFTAIDRRIERYRAEALLDQGVEWLLLEREGEAVALLHANDLAIHLRDPEWGESDLLGAELPRLALGRIDLRATLREGLDTVRDGGVEALLVERTGADGARRRYGVVTTEMLEAAYRYR